MAGAVNISFADALRKDMGLDQAPQKTQSFADVLRSEGIDIGDGTSTAEAIDLGLTTGGRLSDPALAGMVGQTELGPPGLEDFSARIGIAGGDTPEEKMASWEKSYPEGELKVIPQGRNQEPVLLFRKDSSKDFARVDKYGPEWGDIADFLGDDLGAITGEIIALAGPGKIAKLGQVTRAMLGTFAGEMTQEAAEFARGTQREDIGDVSGRALVKSGAAGLGAKFGEVLFEKPINAARGAGLLRVSDEAAEANRMSQELIGEGLPVPVLSDNPILGVLSKQARLNPSVDRKFSELEDRVAAKLVEGVDADSAGQLIEQLRRANAVERARVTRTIEESFEKATTARVGASIQQGIAEYTMRSGAAVNNAYKLARESGDASYDLGKLFLEAQEVIAGKRAVVRPDGGDVAEETMRIGGGGDPPVLDVARNIMRLDPSLPPTTSPKGVVLDGTEQLREFRSKLYDYAEAAPGVLTKEDEVIAGKLRRAIDDTLDSPVSGDKRVVQLYKKANKMARIRFRTRDRLDIIAISKSETPSVIANKIVSGEAPVETVNVLRRILPAKKFRAIQDGVKTRLLDDPFALTQKLSAMPRGTRSRLISPEEIASLQQIGKRFDEMTQIGIQKTLRNQAKASGVIRDLINRDDTAAISLYVRDVRQAGGHNSGIGQATRAGLIEDIVNGSLKVDRSRRIVQPERLRARVQELERTGAIDLLAPADIKLLKSAGTIQDFMDSIDDAGTSMAKAEAARGLIHMKDSAIRFMIQNFGLGRIFTGPVWRQLLVGSGGKQQLRPSRVLKGLSGGLSAASIDPETADRVEKTINNFISNTVGKAAGAVYDLATEQTE